MFLESTNKNFDSMAQEVVDRFFVDKVPLMDTVVKEADTWCLNPEEVKRLVEKTNTAATVQMIKSASDGVLEFDLVDYNRVLGKTHPENSSAVPSNSVTESTLDMLNTLKTASQADTYFASLMEKKAEEPIGKPKPLRELFVLKQDLDKLGREKVAAELQFKAATDRLISDFSSLYGPDFTKFANEAYTVHGDMACPLLEALAGSIRETVSPEKVAYCIDDGTQQMQSFKTAQDAVITANVVQAKQILTREKIAAAWASVKEQVI
jgi:hypothetical protein